MINSKTATFENAHTEYEKSNDLQKLYIADDNYIVCENKEGKPLTVKDYKDFFKNVDNIYYTDIVIKMRTFTEDTVPRYYKDGEMVPIVEPTIEVKIDNKTGQKTERKIYKAPMFDNKGNIKDSKTLSSQSKGGKSRQIPTNYIICSIKRTPKVFAFNETFIGMTEPPKVVETTFLPGFESSKYDYSRPYSTEEIKALIPKYCKFKKSLRNEIKQEYLDDIVSTVRKRKELNLKVINLQNDLPKFEEGSEQYVKCKEEIEELKNKMSGMTTDLANKYFDQGNRGYVTDVCMLFYVMTKGKTDYFTMYGSKESIIQIPDELVWFIWDKFVGRS